MAVDLQQCVLLVDLLGGGGDLGLHQQIVVELQQEYEVGNIELLVGQGAVRRDLDPLVGEGQDAPFLFDGFA